MVKIPKEKRKLIFSTLYWLIGLALILGLPQLMVHLQTKEIPYAQFKYLVKEQRVLFASINKNEIKGLAYTGPIGGLERLRDSIRRIEEGIDNGKASLDVIVKRLRDEYGRQKQIILFRTVRVEDPKLVEFLDKHNVDYTGVQESLISQVFWSTIVPILFWVALWFFLIRSMGRPGAGLLSIGKSKAKIAMEKDTGIRFDDVAGCDEAKEELKEVVEFLKKPEKFRKLGAQIPKGVLLLGPPGTGKTLLARALAGEAGVLFYSISGSEFVEMFVGVGAARVRDLFNQAKQNAPCIIFIDEIDAIGKFRSGGFSVGGHEEREQTLNQLLVEMDGFEPNIGVILLAATNRPEVLDPALMRPGRFDRQVVLDAPDVEGREAILNVHARGKPLAPDVDLRKIALRTPGFSGADLANLMNEAALLAARQEATVIEQAHLEDAVEKVMAGPERKSRRLGEKERRRVAYHEAGHALVAFYCPNAPPVTKISIIPRGKAALGYTLQLPEEEHFLLTKSELEDKICVSLGGRIAEEVVLGEVSSGAQNDLEVATEIARSMVCRFGMSKEVGPLALTRETSPYLKMPGFGEQIRQMSPELMSKVDKEVSLLLESEQQRAREIVENHKDALMRVAEKLLVQEVMSEEEFKRLVLNEN
ncbi:Cell division protein FtsH [Dissulfuribacter thermophilus]|uniref:ATP-dependent zinc metalloprotease FtsH n=1 Tax=Dissulfuribacter thermophilus TaxID=1156395 RepID=A0A1B9F7K1_9BACT|nr:ATP-dependent zinc metalloprotease FtsH [Dissulfuribacter thermophilus]OCC15892.1 Cell division protein FtsH [Dissulfuribacter thermophilus]